MHKLISLLVLLQTLLPVFGDAQVPPTIDLGYAKYQGVFDETANVTDFWGLRFAAPPVGELRWQAPQLPPAVSGVQVASSIPPQCPQAIQGVSPTNPFPHQMKRQSSDTEDCLFLDVHIPGSGIPSTKLPVIFYIHGGGYILGSAPPFRGSDLIAQSGSNGVIVVSIQYRLGLFGFLSGNEIKANGALNAGLLDQNFALQWVHEHISKFGGDPSRVTIWGKSAGGGSVLQHVIAEDGETSPKLFTGVIASSPFLPSQYAFNDTIPQSLYQQVVDSVNCTSSQDTLSCLRQADTGSLQVANAKINSEAFYGTFTFVPVVDGTFIRRRPIEVLQSGTVNGDALLVVSNTNEGDIFVNQTAIPFNASQYAAELFPLLPPQQTVEVAEQYASVGSALTQENLIMGESIFVCPSYFLLSAFKGRSYKGEFAIPPALHADDIPYNFPTSTLFGLPAVSFNNTQFINAFAQSFTSFAISLDPNVKVDPENITPRWEEYSVGNAEIIFNKTNDDLPDVHAATSNADLLARCKFWESVGEFTDQ